MWCSGSTIDLGSISRGSTPFTGTMQNFKDSIKLKHIPQTYEERNELFKTLHKELHLGKPIDAKDCAMINCGDLWRQMLRKFPIPT